MNAPPQFIFRWPEMPALPPLGQPVLIRVDTAQPRKAARQELRSVLRKVLAAWSSLSPEQIPLYQTTSGPVWRGQLGGQKLNISLSYAEGAGCIGLISGGRIGVDIMRIQRIPEAEAVAHQYLGPAAWANIQGSPDPALAFAGAWTGWEARLKCFKREMAEWSIEQEAELTPCGLQSVVYPDRLIVTMAHDKSHSW
jgi:phosphopantetheinyl transferase